MDYDTLIWINIEVAFTKGITCCACIFALFYITQWIHSRMCCNISPAAFKGSNDFDYFNIFDYFMNDRSLKCNSMENISKEGGWKYFNASQRFSDFPLSQWNSFEFIKFHLGAPIERKVNDYDSICFQNWIWQLTIIQFLYATHFKIFF